MLLTSPAMGFIPNSLVLTSPFAGEQPALTSSRSIYQQRSNPRLRQVTSPHVVEIQRLITATSAPPLIQSNNGSIWSPQTHPLYLYNTLTREKQKFTTIEPNVVRFYSCGPTVYDFAHIGNFRAFLTYDVIKRWLLYRGYFVNHVTNLTDVDDKIIRKACELNCSAQSLTEKFADAFFDDLQLLNIIPAQHYPRATQHINDIEEIITNLKYRRHAYQRDGSTYFSVSSFSSYGRLAELDKRQAGSLTTTNADIQSTDRDEYDKNDLRDFALWKAYKDEDGDVYWNTSLGKGRPGWHIECSCMAMKYLGPEIDIHAGGIDLVFPHHENEIAQSEAATGRPFSKFWLHNGFINIDNEKMSKSLGNFRTLRDIISHPIDARAFRYLVLSSQYRSALAFTEQCMKSARSTIKRLDTLQTKLRAVSCEDPEENILNNIINKASEEFRNAMDDDLNTPRAAAAMFSLVNSTEKLLKSEKIGKYSCQAVLDCLADMDRVFGIFYTPIMNSNSQPKSVIEDMVSPELEQLIKERSEARKAKNYQRADEIRDIITSAGFAIVDTKEGAELKKISC